MSSSPNLVLLYGGKSGEHEISLISAASVLLNLDASRYNIIPIGIDKDGCYFINDYKELLTYENALPVKTAHSKPLDSLIKNGKLAVDADVVFPVVHGPLYEDGCLQGLLTLANVAFVGCDVLSSAIGMDKDIARRLACVNGIKSAAYLAISSYAKSTEISQFCEKSIAELGLPLFVKPCSMGSSVGIHKVHDKATLMDAINDARHYDKDVLVEAYIKGREIELAVLESTIPGMAPSVSVAGEICVHHADGFYSYSAKYLESEQTGLEVPAQLDDELLHRLQTISADIFTRLKCRGMARVDFFVDEDSAVYFNEINTLPGFTTISMYPKLWQASGLSYSTLLNRLIEIALMHHQNRQHLVTHYQ